MTYLILPEDPYERVRALAELEEWLQDHEPTKLQVAEVIVTDTADDYPHLNG